MLEELAPMGRSYNSNSGRSYRSGPATHGWQSLLAPT